MITTDPHPSHSPEPTIQDVLNRLAPDALFWGQDALQGARRVDLEKMQAMHAAHLPITSILVPTDSTLAKQQTLPQAPIKLDLSKQLSQFFPCHFVAALYELQSILTKIDAQAYVIGGIVRDLLIAEDRRLELNDVDITVVGDALAYSRQIESMSRNFHIEQAFPEFGTAILHYKDLIYIDMASTRRERYPACGALPEVFERGVPLADDVIRRDFTMNSLALAIHHLGEIVDWTGGIDDIQHQRIQVLHGASFFEDPSRILRAYKFGSRLNFQLEEATEGLIESFLEHGKSVYKGGGERIKEELCEFLQAFETPVKARWLKRFSQTRTLQLCDTGLTLNTPSTEHPWACIVDRFHQIEQALGVETSESESPEELDTPALHMKWVTYLCLVLEDLSDESLEPLCHRMSITREEREAVVGYRQLKNKDTLQLTAKKATIDWEGNVQQYHLFKPYAAGSIAAWLVSLPNSEMFHQALEAWVHYRRDLATLSPELDGHDLMDIGVPAGQQVGQALKSLLNAKLAGKIASRLDEIRYIKQEVLHQPLDTFPTPPKKPLGFVEEFDLEDAPEDAWP